MEREQSLLSCKPLQIPAEGKCSAAWTSTQTAQPQSAGTQPFPDLSALNRGLSPCRNTGTHVKTPLIHEKKMWHVSSLCHPVVLGAGRGFCHPVAVVPVHWDTALGPLGYSKASSGNSRCPSGDQAKWRSSCCSMKACGLWHCFASSSSALSTFVWVLQPKHRIP